MDKEALMYEAAAQFAVDNFNVGNEAHSIQNQLRLKYISRFPAIDKESSYVEKQGKGNKRKRRHLQDNQDEEYNDGMSDFSLSIAERKEMRNVVLVEDDSEQEEIMEEEDNLEERAEEADVSILEEPFIAPVCEGSLMSDDAWTVVMARIEQYRKNIPASHCLFDPLYYYIIDHSGRHGPTTKLINEYLPSMHASLPKEMEFSLPAFSDKDAEFFDMLVMAGDMENVEAKSSKEHIAKKLMSRIKDAVSMRTRNSMSEMEHISRNIMPFIDATIGHQQEFQVHYGEKTLRATAVRRNKGSDPAKCAKTGYKVDVLVELDSLWKPALGCGEVSGGLPHCSLSKEWSDTLKLALELRDVWAMAQDELEGIDATKLVVWGFIVIERKLRIYALAVTGGLFHFVLTFQTLMPSSMDDLWSAQVAYLAMMSFQNKLQATMKTLYDLNHQKVILLRSGQKNPVKKMQPLIVSSPIKGKR